MIQAYNVFVAKECGILEASILHNLEGWLSEISPNQHNIQNCECHVGCSIDGFASLFPFASTRQIRRALKSLEKNGYIKVSNLSEDKRDKIKWYTLTSKYFSLKSKRSTDKQNN